MRIRYVAAVCAVLLVGSSAYSVVFVLTVPLGPETSILYFFLSLVFVPLSAYAAILSGWRLLEENAWSRFGATLGTVAVAASGAALLQWLLIDFLMWKNKIVFLQPWKALCASLVVTGVLYAVSRRYTLNFVSKYPGRGYLLFSCICLFVSAFHAFQFIPEFSQKGEQAASLAHFPAEELLNEPAPAFALGGPYTGKYELINARGKVVLLNFWTTWCGPCQAELPHLQKMEEELGTERFTLLAINADTDTACVKPFVDSLGYKFKTLFGREIMRDYRVHQFPVTFVVDKKGIIRSVFVGYFKSTPYKMRAVVRKLIEEQMES